MRVPLVVSLSLCALTVAQSTLAAQAALTPPSLLQALCETVKPGMGIAHDQHEAKWARALEAVKGTTVSSLAVKSSTGANAVCWLTATTSYDALSKMDNAINADPAYARAVPGLVAAEAQYVNDSRSYIATLRADLSGGPMPNVLTRRAMIWSEWRIRPGQEGMFEAAVKAYRAAMERGKVPADYRVYQVMQGAPSATFWVFASRTDMAGFDADLANDAKIMGAMTPDDGKQFDEFFAKAVVSVNSQLWTYNSRLSTLTAEQRATDPFWKLPSATARTP